MEDFIKIENYLANGSDGNIVKQPKNPLRGLLVLLVGIAVIVFSTQCSMPETAQIASLSLGVLAALVGGMMLVLLSTSDCGGYRFKTTGAPLCRYRRYVASDDRQRLIDSVSSADMRLLGDIHKESSTSTLLQAFVAKDGSYAVLQVEGYIPHDFVPRTAPVSLDKENASLLLQWLKN